jgi:D-alanyl-D-alanine carboxypeptidase/D-alanyl-D-alanine-endopeptidase (penicillin-binding protein 4)
MYSPPLQELIKEINRESNNLYAEVLLRILAKELKTDDAIKALETSLNKLNISSANYSLEDASGLSRQNLITPETLVQILSVMANTANRDIYRTSLAVAGNNGTLKQRLSNTELQNNLWGKTGSLSGVITLAGYLKIADRETIAFSILVNNFDDKNTIARQAIDEIILLLPQFTDCF